MTNIRFLYPGDVEAILGVSRADRLALERKGFLPAYRLPGGWRVYRVRDVEACAAACGIIPCWGAVVWGADPFRGLDVTDPENPA